jgi:hypothetical protein
VPKSCTGVPSPLLLPSNTWDEKEAYTLHLRHLAQLFVNNFRKFEVGRKRRRMGGDNCVFFVVLLQLLSLQDRCMRNTPLLTRPVLPCTLPLQDGGGHMLPEEVQQLVQAGPSP